MKELTSTRSASALVEQLAALLIKHHTRVSDLFKFLDKTTDGVVSKEELRRTLVEGMGLTIPTAELDKLFERFDQDGSGGVSFRELQSVMMEAMHGASRPEKPELGPRPTSGARPATVPTSLSRVDPNIAALGVGRQRRSSRFSRQSQEELFWDKVEEGKLLDPGSAATLEKCLECVRRASIDSRTALTARQLLQRAAGHPEQHDAPATPRKAFSPPLVDDTIDETNRQAAEQALAALRAVAAEANEQLRSLFCRQLFNAAIAQVRSNENSQSLDDLRPGTAPAAMNTRPSYWWPERWWSPVRVSPRPYATYQPPSSPMPSPRGMVWNP